MITEEQKEARRKGLGGSDIAGIIPSKDNATGTLSPWLTQVQVWNSKLHPELEEEKEGEQLWWGNEEEGLVAKRFMDLTGKKVVNHNKMIIDGCLIANLDRLIVPEGQKIAAYHGEIRTNEIFEAKTAGYEWDKSDIIRILPNGAEIRDGAAGIPVAYGCQCNHYLGRVPSAERIYVGVKMAIPCGKYARTEFGIYVLERNDEIIKAQDAYARDWWERHIVKGEMPTAICEEDCKILWRRSTPFTHVFIDKSILANYRKLKEAKEAKAVAEENEKEAKAALQQAMGTNEAILGDDNETVLATWKSQKDKTIISVDWEKVAKGVAGCYLDGAARLEESVKEFTTTTVKTGSRTFLLKTSDKVSDYIARKEFQMQDEISAVAPMGGSVAE